MKTSGQGFAFYLLLSATTLLCLTACSSSQSAELTGPWASEFEQAIQETNVKSAQSILQDGSISDAELSSVQQEFANCVSDLGFPGLTFPEKGGYSVPDRGRFKEASEATSTCEKQTGFDSISALYKWTRINPNNEDMRVLVSSCLIRHEVVAPDYSPEQYEKELEAYFKMKAEGNNPNADMLDALSYTDPVRGPEVFQKCNDTPLE